jgi:hypothetical protein
MKWVRRILGKNIQSEIIKQDSVGMKVNSREVKIRKAADDFAVRFEDVMKELSKG